MTPSHTSSIETADRRRLRTALIANLAMFVTGLCGWYIADSASLLADALDMLADASGYVVAMLAVGRTLRFKKTQPVGMALC